MGNLRPFRVGIQSRSVGPRDQWLATVRRVEDLGYDAIGSPDHFVRGLDPIVALSAAAIATTRLHLARFVFDRPHPRVGRIELNSVVLEPMMEAFAPVVGR